MEKTKIEDLIQFLRKFCLHQSLAYIGAVQVDIFNEKSHLSKYYPQSINEWCLAFIAKILILNSNDHRAKLFHEDDLLNAVNMYNNLYERISDLDNSKREEFNSKMYSFLIYTANQQFPLQSGIWPQIPRSYILFEFIPNEIKNPAFDIGKEIKKIYGLSVKEILILGFAVFAAIKNGYFYPEYLININHDALKKITTKENIFKLISKISADYNALRKLFDEEETREGYEKYSFNSLKSYPVVVTQLGHKVIPVPRYLIDICTTGIYYNLMDRFKESKSNAFLEFFGKEIFESYVGLLLKQKYKEKELLKEWEYIKNKQVCKTSDWTIICGNTAILIECKTSGINKEAKSFADLEQVQKNLKLRIVQAIKQMNTIIDNAKESAQGLEKLFKINKFYFIVVTFDRIFLAGTPIIKELIQKELDKINIRQYPDYQVISIEELENLIPLLDAFSFEYILDQKFKDKAWSTYDFDVFISHFVKKNGIDLKINNKLLMDKYNELFDGLRITKS